MMDPEVALVRVNAEAEREWPWRVWLTDVDSVIRCKQVRFKAYGWIQILGREHKSDRRSYHYPPHRIQSVEEIHQLTD